jgi:hypothetical protein
MKALSLKIYREDPETGEMRPWSKKQLQVVGVDLDEAMKKAHSLIEKEGLPPIKSMNAAPGGVLLIYCAEVSQRAEAPVGQTEPRRPPRLKKL